ncbi:MAG: HD domain-containing protein [Bacilli bacterium]|nr:HD domain-containing protein [Bacilli bacterium]
MIDIENSIKLFSQYVNNYDISNPKILSKYKHTFRVMENSKVIAKELGLNNEDVDLAMLIGLLHDIGRFEQAVKFDSYGAHVPFDHAKYGVEVLKKDNYIDEFIVNKRIQDIVLTAVNNHNKYCIDEGLDDRTLLFCKIIRDADKLDILNKEVTEEFNFSNSTISDDIYDFFVNKELVDDKKVQTDLDFELRHMAFIFDINFNCTYEIIKNKNIIDKVFDRFIEINSNEKEKLKKIKNMLNNYIEGEINVR